MRVCNCVIYCENVKSKKRYRKMLMLMFMCERNCVKYSRLVDVDVNVNVVRICANVKNFLWSNMIVFVWIKTEFPVYLHSISLKIKYISLKAACGLFFVVLYFFDFSWEGSQVTLYFTSQRSAFTALKTSKY